MGLISSKSPLSHKRKHKHKMKYRGTEGTEMEKSVFSVPLFLPYLMVELIFSVGAPSVSER